MDTLPLISGEGKKAIRTGVTAILPQGKKFNGRLFAAWHTLNGNGEMTGTTWLEESGMLNSPIMITGTYSVGAVKDAVLQWAIENTPDGGSGDPSLAVVAETYDGFLHNARDFSVKKEHVYQALNGAKDGPIAEGNVGGGTGMVAFDFKGGTGTASRVLDKKFGGYTVGILVQANYGARRLFRVAGVPVGKEITDLASFEGKGDQDSGSIIVVIATDAPLLPHQLKRLVKRASLGIAAPGGFGGNTSGDIFIAFSTANATEASNDKEVTAVQMLPIEKINPLFEATVQATEEAVINALVAAETMKGVNGNTVFALPHDRLKAVLKKYNRLNDPIKQ
ncbi:MAG: P1 family peptidase [Pyrinomonadaceae bacterium]